MIAAEEVHKEFLSFVLKVSVLAFVYRFMINFVLLFIYDNEEWVEVLWYFHTHIQLQFLFIKKDLNLIAFP